MDVNKLILKFVQDTKGSRTSNTMLKMGIKSENQQYITSVFTLKMIGECRLKDSYTFTTDNLVDTDTHREFVFDKGTKAILQRMEISKDGIETAARVYAAFTPFIKLY